MRLPSFVALVLSGCALVACGEASTSPPDPGPAPGRLPTQGAPRPGAGPLPDAGPGPTPPPPVPPPPPEKDGGKPDDDAGCVRSPRGQADATCAEALRRCSVRFKYRDNGESRIEVRGSFKPDGWTSGVLMQKRGTTWTADVLVPVDKDVEYKLFLDGRKWIKDPGNPQTSGGHDNSLLEAVRCSPYVCASE